MSKPAQLAKTKEEYIERLGDWRGARIAELCAFIQATIPKAEDAMIWGQIVFQLNGPFCSVKAFRNQVTLGFWRGAELSDMHKLLKKSSDQIKHIDLKERDLLPLRELRELIKQAAKLNRELGNPTGAYQSSSKSSRLKRSS